MERVLGGFQEPNRSSQMSQRGLAMPLHRGEARKGPVKPDACIRIEECVGAGSEVSQNLASLLKSTEVRQRIAEMCRKTNPRARVILSLGRQPT